MEKETKIIYYIDDEETPYLVKLNIAPECVTLSDFKNVLNRPNFKFFFKSMDADFGVVKEEIIDDDAHLPCFSGRVVSWLVSADGSSVSDGTPHSGDGIGHTEPKLTGETSTDNLHIANPITGRLTADDTCTETESFISSRQSRNNLERGSRHHGDKFAKYRPNAPFVGSRINGHSKHRSRHEYESSVISSDLETTSFLGSDDDASSVITSTTDRATNVSIDRVSFGTEHSSVSRIHLARRRPRRRKRHRAIPEMSRTSSFSSITDSTMSLNIITVSLNMDTVNFLGISIVGQSNKGGDGGIYVGSIMKGGAVALDGRIEPGDMILQVNDINFENMTNDQAVRVLREVVQKPGPIKLVVAKCWDPNPKGYFTIPRTEPVRPIDPGAWVAHTAAVRGESLPVRPASVTTLTSSNSSIASSIAETEKHLEEFPLTVNTDMATIVKAMARPHSGLEIRDRMWLKITIPNAFIGCDVVDWLHNHVQGFVDRRDAQKFASRMLKMGYIRHTVNKVTFSEQCYYVFGDICSTMSSLKLHDDGASSDRDTVGPLHVGPNMPAPWGSSQMLYSGMYMPHTGAGYAPMPFSYTNDTVHGYQREESVHSASGGSSNGSEHICKDPAADKIRCGSSASESEVRDGLITAKPAQPAGKSVGSKSRSSGSEHSVSTTSTASPQSQHPLQQTQDLSGSRQSFRIAMGNPCEFFVDVM